MCGMIDHASREMYMKEASGSFETYTTVPPTSFRCRTAIVEKLVGRFFSLHPCPLDPVVVTVLAGIRHVHQVEARLQTIESTAIPQVPGGFIARSMHAEP